MPEGRIPGTARILCLGDSYTFGEGVRDEDTWPARLQRILDERASAPRFEVINAGVQALGTRLEERLLRHLLVLQPDLVVLGFFMNDAMPDAETIRIQERAAEDVAAGRASPSRVLGFLVERLRARRRQDAYLRSITASFEGASWDSCRTQLGRMKAMCDESGAGFLVVIFPLLWQLEDRPALQEEVEKVKAACSALGCRTLDLHPLFRGRPSRSLWAHPTDPHPNKEAHGLAAGAIAAEVLRE